MPRCSPLVFMVAAGATCLTAGAARSAAPASRLTVDRRPARRRGRRRRRSCRAGRWPSLGGATPVGAVASDPGSDPARTCRAPRVRPGRRPPRPRPRPPGRSSSVSSAWPAAWVFAGALSEPMRTRVPGVRPSLPTIAFVIGGLASTGLARAELAASGRRVRSAGEPIVARRPARRRRQRSGWPPCRSVTGSSG